MQKIMERFGYTKHSSPATSSAAPPLVPFVLPRSYAGARIDRLTADFQWPVTTGDTELRWYLRILRARSRELARNNDYVRKFLKMCVANIIGPNGITLQNKARDPNGAQDKLANDIIEEAWLEWGKKGICTVDGQMTWLDAQNLFVESTVRDGAVIVRKVRGFDNPFKFALQFLEVDYLDEDLNRDLADGNSIRMGIEFDRWQRPIAYHLLVKHPGDYMPGASTKKYERIPASDIIHTFIKERASQTREAPWLHTAMRRLNMVGEYEEAELVASRIGASWMGFFTRPADVAGFLPGDTKDATGAPVITASPGIFEQLPPGWELQKFDPSHPAGNYQPFLKSILRGIASGLNVSYNSLACDLEGVNYSSIRSATLEERDMWRTMQTWAYNHFHTEVFTEWLSMSILSGAISLPYTKLDKFNKPAWRPRTWSWVDPYKDIQADIEAMDNGLVSRTKLANNQGEDFEELMEQIALEKSIMKKYGVEITVKAAAPAQPPPPSNPKKSPDKGGNDEEDET